MTDPRAMRALAHPTRVAILDHLYVHGPATATECAAAVNESPSSCSFHLRTLARWGFVESLPTKGRQRPWRPLARTIRGPLHIPDGAVGTDGTDAAMAPLELVREYARRDDRLLEQFLEHQAEFSAEWRGAADFSSRTLLLTPAEAKHLSAALRALIEPYLPEHVPAPSPESGRVYLVFRTIPAIDPLQQPE